LYSWDGELPVERWQIKSVGRDTQTFIGVLNVTGDYFVRVQARNSHGFGPKSDVVRFRVTPPSSELGNVVNIFAIITPITSCESNLTKRCIAAAHGRFIRVRQVASMCTPV